MRDWDYLATAPNQVVAEMWRDMLVQNGIPAMLQPHDIASYYGVMAQPVRVMDAKGKLDVARAMLEGWEDVESEGVTDEGPEEPSDDSVEGKGR